MGALLLRTTRDYEEFLTCSHIPGLLWVEGVERKDPETVGLEISPVEQPPGG